ncbi:MAG: cysteine--tRNA ligase, partial [Rhizobiales bacterium]|nr:cysteine--tRNA ligase [Hyphomicrobiales bacterium]
MVLTLHNTLTRKKAPFTPLDWKDSSIPESEKMVRMYVCGPTVYDNAHIGNARPIIVFDVLYRLLRHIYGADHVTYARNITDVDDKINARAAEEYPDLPLNEAIARVTELTIVQFHKDIEALGVLPPDVEPACTDHIPQMVEMIKVLIAKGNAYEAESHVLLDTTTIQNYGRLSGRTLDEMIAGARVEVAPYKRNPADSVLWKPSTDEQPGWDSPWGRGRPGWHIECSAMSKEYLGEVFDIHGGGIDLTFPHHENELAQSTCVHGTSEMAQVWMHNGYLQVEGRKMSKSDGNFVTINELLTGWQGVRWPGAVLRLAMLSTHYRQPIDWTKDRLEQAGAKLMYIREFRHDVPDTKPSEAVLSALMDDLNTPKALTELYKLLEESKSSQAQGAVLDATCKFLGLDTKNVTPQHMFQGVDEGQVENLIEARNKARAG